MQYIIVTKDDKVFVEAEDRDHAFAKYFYDIINEKVTLDKIGGIILLKDGKNEYGFRTVPLLWKMGIIGTRFAVWHISQMLGVSHTEAKQMLKDAGDADARIIPLIEDLRLMEEKEDE